MWLVCQNTALSWRQCFHLFSWFRDNLLSFIFDMMATGTVFRNIDSDQEHLESATAIVTIGTTTRFSFPCLYYSLENIALATSAPWKGKAHHRASVLHLVETLLFWTSFLFRGLPQIAFRSNSVLTLIDAILLFGDWLIKASLSKISLLCLLCWAFCFTFFVRVGFFHSLIILSLKWSRACTCTTSFRVFPFPVLKPSQIKTLFFYFRVLPGPI